VKIEEDWSSQFSLYSYQALCKEASFPPDQTRNQVTLDWLGIKAFEGVKDRLGLNAFKK
jgi:hypothetical protein